MLELNPGYEIALCLPGFVGFGSNGAGELFAFAPSGEVAMIPFTPMQIREAQTIAADFVQLAAWFGRAAI